MKSIIFNNNDLNFEIEKIKSFNLPIVVSKSFDKELDYVYGLDVEDSTYWYANESDRDKDYENLKKIIPEFTYI